MSFTDSFIAGCKAGKGNSSGALGTPSVTRRVALFVHKHPFLERLQGHFTKSERRQFERDVYDYSEALGLDHAVAKKQVIKARTFCGEEDFDSDTSALFHETDNSAEILEHLDAKSWSEWVVCPFVEDAGTGQIKTPITSSGLKTSPKKSPYFRNYNAAILAQRKRKRNASSKSDSMQEAPHKRAKSAGHKQGIARPAQETNRDSIEQRSATSMEKCNTRNPSGLDADTSNDQINTFEPEAYSADATREDFIIIAPKRKLDGNSKTLETRKRKKRRKRSKAQVEGSRGSMTTQASIVRDFR